jgi:manganese/zinc/iron transport system permease protein
MTGDVIIVLTAGLVATACGLLGPFLVLRRVALMSDAVAHAVLPGIVAVFLLFQTRAPLYVIAGATVFAVLCVLAIDALKGTGLIKADAAISIVFPTLFGLGVLGVQRYADNVHLDLDATIYGEIAFAPFRILEVGSHALARTVVLIGLVAVVNLLFVSILWKELKATSFDPGFARTIRISPLLISRLLLIAVAVTAVTAFESVGAILVVTLLIVPATTALLLTNRLLLMVILTVAIGWVSAIVGYLAAVRIDDSIAGSIGLVAAAGFVLALLASPRYGVLARSLSRLRHRRVIGRFLGAGDPDHKPLSSVKGLHG